MSKIKTNYAEIIVGGCNPEKPYFSIRYFDLADMDYHYGFGSYDLKQVYRWLDNEFEIVDEKKVKVDVEKKKFDLEGVFARILSDIERLKANVYETTSDLHNVKTIEDLYKWHETHDIEKGLLHIRIVGDEL